MPGMDFTEDELTALLLQHVEDGNVEMVFREEDGEPLFRLTKQGRAQAEELAAQLFGPEDGQHRLHRREYEGEWNLPCPECGGDPDYTVSVGMGFPGPCQTCLGESAR